MQPISENDISNHRLFLSKDNTTSVISSLYAININHGFDMPISYFYKWVPIKMKEWAKTHFLDSYQVLGSQSVNYYVAELQYINRQFIRYYYGDAALETSLHNRISDINMPYDEIQLAKFTNNESDNDYRIEKKPLKELLASDYGMIDVWTAYDVSSRNSRYRNNNQINIDQISRHARPYDRKYATEGLRATIDNSSYTNNHQRGFGSVYRDYINNMTNDKDRHFYL